MSVFLFFLPTLSFPVYVAMTEECWAGVSFSTVREIQHCCSVVSNVKRLPPVADTHSFCHPCPPSPPPIILCHPRLIYRSTMSTRIHDHVALVLSTILKQILSQDVFLKNWAALVSWNSYTLTTTSSPVSAYTHTSSSFVK